MAAPPRRILIVTPPRTLANGGNAVTAGRWRDILTGLGHRVEVAERSNGAPVDLLVALHARKSFDSVARFREAGPRRPLVVALTGTDLYGDLAESREAARAIEMADALVLLQKRGIEELPPALRDKARVIYQSAAPPDTFPPKPDDRFQVAVLAHLREVKDPLRTAAASRLLPESSRIRVLHAGAALEDDLAAEARRETGRNPRYEWVGPVPRREASLLLAGSHLMVLSSRMEGGANAIAEALAAQVPVLVSDAPGNLGMLDEGYPGTFPVGDTTSLAELMARAETDREFYRCLQEACRRAAPRFRPEDERSAWKALLAELFTDDPER